MANFEIFFPTLIKHEGGFSNDKNDKGGPTKYGITHQVLSEYRKTAISTDDVRALTLEEAKKIYIAKYWNPLNMSLVNSQNLAETIFDHGVNAGIGRAAKMVQEILNRHFGKKIAVDGAIGAIETIPAINSVDAAKLYNLFNEMRGRYYTFIANRWDDKKADSAYLENFFRTKLKVGKKETNSDFIKGWLNRLASFPYIKEAAMGVGIFLLLAGAFFFSL